MDVGSVRIGIAKSDPDGVLASPLTTVHRGKGDLAAELGHEIDKETFDAQVPALREALLQAQYEITTLKKFPIIIVVGGVDGAV